MGVELKKVIGGYVLVYAFTIRLMVRKGRVEVCVFKVF